MNTDDSNDDFTVYRVEGNNFQHLYLAKLMIALHKEFMQDCPVEAMGDAFDFTMSAYSTGFMHGLCAAYGNLEGFIVEAERMYSKAALREVAQRLAQSLERNT